MIGPLALARDELRVRDTASRVFALSQHKGRGRIVGRRAPMSSGAGFWSSSTGVPALAQEEERVLGGARREKPVSCRYSDGSRD